jgi:pyrroline-5-carboxylate reductase
MKVLIIGCGNMGFTYAESFLKSHILTKDDFLILQRSKDRRNFLLNQGFNHVYSEAGSFISEGDIVIIAVKPQDWASLASTIKPFVEEDQLFISIMAGIELSSIQSDLGVKKVIRAMPNLPSQIGVGMTTYTSADEVTRGELMFAQNMLGSTGQAMYLKEERMIDASTAVSGSGPAYIFYFMKAIIEGAIDLGFTQSEAEQLVKQTFRGSVQLQNRSEISMQEWIDKVASKGGTTEAALNSFGIKVEGEIKAGVKAAFNRAIELSKR